MPRRCTVCDHRERDKIDAALVSGAPLRDIAGRHGVSKSALERHKGAHLPPHLAKARAAEEVAGADALLLQVRHCKTGPWASSTPPKVPESCARPWRP